MAYKRKDSFHSRAKRAGYRSRAAYKLLELAQRYELIARGDHVVDLGAWPGGWLQVAAQLAGPRGIVVGVDLQAIEPVGNSCVSSITGDARESVVQDQILKRSAGRVDVLLSDMSPKLTGVRTRDAAAANELARSAIAVADRILRPNGRLLVKIFTTPDTEQLTAIVRQRFRTVKLTKPEATRKASAELYIVGVGFLKGDR